MTVNTNGNKSAVIKYPVESGKINENNSFLIPFQFLKNKYCINVYLRKKNGEKTNLENTDYDVEILDGTDGKYGQVVIKKEYEGIRSLCIYRNIEDSQKTKFDSQTMFSSTTEAAFDKLTMLYQDNQFKAHTIHAPDDDVVSSIDAHGKEVSHMQLPSAPERANKYLHFDEDGNVELKNIQNKALRQNQDEEPDSSFELQKDKRLGKFISFDKETGSVVYQNLYTAGDNISIGNNNIIAAKDTVYELPVAAANTLGGVKIGNNIEIETGENAGKISVPQASKGKLGVVKIGKSLYIDDKDNNAINIKSFIFPEGYYTAPKASDRANKIINFDSKGNPIYPPIWDFDNYRNIRVNITEKTDKLDIVLPGPEVRQGKVIGFNKDNGNKLEMIDISYELPVANENTLGGVRVIGGDTNININNEVISCDVLNTVISNNLFWVDSQMPLSASWESVTYGNGMFCCCCHRLECRSVQRRW